MAGAAKYQPYPAYKPSGVEWLGDIPEGWEAIRLKLTSDFRNEKRNINPSDNYVGLENIVPWVGSYKPSQDQESEGLSLSFSEGDLLFGKLRPYLAKSWLAEFGGVCSSEFLVISAKSLDPKFINYVTLTEDFINQVDGSTYGSKMPRANSEFIGQIKFPIPDSDDATKIAAFLDYETGKIDGLIAKQQRLIALLEEKRQAVISHAVTKGLDPTAPLRPSGIDWLGDVPAHWEVKPLKYLCTFSGGGTPSKEVISFWRGGTVPWVSPKDMKSFYVTETQDKITPAAVENSSTNYVEVGALLMVVRSGILQRAIPIAINRNRVTLNQDMKAIRFYAEVVTEYAANYILGHQRELLLEWSKEGATVESIEQEYLSQHLFPVPPLREQQKICEFLDRKKSALVALTDKAQSAITLLKERRTALISAAVTGKIDLRGWQAPSDATDTTQDKEVLA